MAEAGEDKAGERLNNLIAVTIAVLASFGALATIKSSNVAQAMEQAQAERNDGWAWYQAVRVREDMATYELANLQRLERVTTERREKRRLAADVTAQEAEVGRVRARKDEVEARAMTAEGELTRLSAIADQYDFSDALLAIAMALLAVCALARVRWLYWFSLAPTFAGVVWGLASMMKVVIPGQEFMAWLN
jgi:hypothetical protein